MYLTPHRTWTTVASYARLVSEPKAPALDAAAKVRQNLETTKPDTKQNEKRQNIVQDLISSIKSRNFADR